MSRAENVSLAADSKFVRRFGPESSPLVGRAASLPFGKSKPGPHSRGGLPCELADQQRLLAAQKWQASSLPYDWSANSSFASRSNRLREQRRCIMAKTFVAPFERPHMAAEIGQRHAVRRWLAMGIVTLLLACVAAVVGVRWFSRLNPVERSLVGDWSFVTIDPTLTRHLRLQPDRTFVIR